jgi:ABC-2 type transport system permease protein
MNRPNLDMPAPVALSRGFALRPLAALFALSLGQQLRGRRLLVLAVLFSLPAVLAAVLNLAFADQPPPDGLEFGLVMNLMPHALVPLASLLCASGIIRDEIEEQTLTYLLLRPLPRWAIYLVKMAVTILVVAGLTAVFVFVTLAVIHLTSHKGVTAGLWERSLEISGILALVEAAYCGLFGFLGLLTRRSLLAGVGYIVLIEGLLASFDTVARRLTIMYYFRVLALRWVGPEGGEADWKIPLATAPEASTCALVLAGTGILLTVLAAVWFATGEFRMKTPEGG